MSAFRELLTEAETLGVTKLVFEVDPRGYNEDDQKDRWECRASVPLPVQVISTVGRTGEEALRRVVGFLRRIA